MLFSVLSPTPDQVESAFACLTEAAWQLRSCRKVETLLRTGVQLTQSLFKGDRVLICQATDYGNVTVVAEIVGEEWRSLLGQKIAAAQLALSPTAIAPPEAGVAIDQVDASHLDATAIAALTAYQVKACLARGIWIDAPPTAAETTQLWGWVVIQQCQSSYHWQPLQGEALQHLAMQIGATLERLQWQAHLETVESQTAALIAQTEAKYQQATRACSIGVWDWDLDTNEIYLDPLLKEMLGYRDEEIRNHIDDWVQYVYEADLPAVMAAATDHLEGRTPEYRVEHRMVHRDGHLVWVLAQGAAQRSPDGTPYRLVGTDIDITERKIAELALAKQTQQERAFNEVAQAVRSSLELDTIFVEAAAAISDFLTGEVAIVQYLPAEGCWRHQVVYSQGNRQVTKQYVDVPDADNPFAQQLKRLEVVQVDNTGTIDDPINRHLAADSRYRAWLMVPIGVEGVIWGSLTLARSTHPLPWLTDEVQLAQRVAEQLAIAIHQANLYQQLQSAHERDALVLQSIGEGVWDWDPNEDVILDSDRYWEILGYDPQRQGLSSFVRELERIHPDDRAVVQDTAYRHLEQQEPFVMEFRMQHRQGHYLWIRARGQAVWNEHGHPIRMLGTIEDISDRKQAELDLQASETFRRQVMELAPVPLYIYDLELGQLTYCNPAYEASLGYSQAEIKALGKAFLPAIFPTEDHELITTYDQQLLADRTGEIFEWEHTCLRKDGSLRLLQNREVILTRRADGTPKEILGFDIDLTELKQAEASLIKSNALYESLTDAMPQYLYRKDREGRVTYVNSAYLRWLNITAADVIGKTVYDFYPPDLAANYDAADRQVIATGEILDLVEEHQPPSQNERIYVQVVKSPVRDGEGNIVGTQGIFWDVTARRQLEQALQVSRDELAMILNSLHAAVARFRLTGDVYDTITYDYYSPGTETVFGYPPAMLQHQPQLWRSRVIPEDLVNIIVPAVQELRSGKPYTTIEYRFRHPDESIHWIQETISATQATDQDDWTFTIIATDISDRQQAEVDLQQTRTLLQQVLDHLPVGVFAKTADTRQYTLWNPACTQLTGINRDDAIGRTDHDLLLPEQANQCIADDQAAIASHQLWERPQERVELGDGRSHIIHNRKVVVYDATDTPQLIIGIVEDITARVTAEASLRQREAEFRTLAENSPDGILRVDAAFCLQYVNPTIERRLALPQAALLGRPVTAFDLPSASQWQAAIAQAFATGQEQQLETQESLPAGDHFFQSRIVPEHNNQGDITSVLIVSRDITSLKQAQTALLHRANQEHALRMITQHIRESLDLAPILAAVVEEVQQLLQADRTLIFQLTSAHSGIVVQEQSRTEFPTILAMQWEDEHFSPNCYAFYQQAQGRIVQDITQDDWGDCLIEFMQSIGVQSKMVAPITQTQTDGTTSVWGLLITHACATRRHWQKDELTLLQQVAQQLAIALQQSQLHQQLLAANHELEHLSTTDGLTRIANRRQFDNTLTVEWQRAQREHRELTLVLCDIDYFKQYNDTYGHPAGDDCLIAVAQALKNCVNRSTDCVARYGGEEFAIILPNTNLTGAIVVLKQMQAAIAELNLAHDTHPTASRVTLSYGVTVAKPGHFPTVGDLLGRADLALYQAKQAGRDRYAVAPPIPLSSPTVMP
ncbi:PAS domain S-box protein [Leptolyngbya iicbica]|uniref:PAS domain S-box protein n=2 Tax=Cyanophyceae TaxID=3028117 RepID=A0A4Q7E9T1_9CYAN|nr:PAS domain S-box protein [Leptolyngbya sp. LK]RZM79311.1 PAS domain S-box protein [Leptolyngbya sp. LK]